MNLSTPTQDPLLVFGAAAGEHHTLFLLIYSQFYTYTHTSTELFLQLPPPWPLSLKSDQHFLMGGRPPGSLGGEEREKDAEEGGGDPCRYSPLL